MPIPAQVKYIGLTTLFVIGSFNFVRTTMEIVENSKRLDSLGDEVSTLESKKEGLEQSVAYKNTDDFIEEKARNDLNLIKPGEKVYVFPKKSNPSTLDTLVLGEASSKEGLNYEGTDKNNIQKWIEFLF